MTEKRQKKDHDFSVNAFRVVQEATEQADDDKEEQTTPTNDKNPNAVALGRLGGLKGGKARASKLTPEKRKEIARIAANARWKKE